MPADVQVYRQMRRCVVRYAGPLRAADVIAGVKDQAALGAWYLPTFIDLSEATRVEMTFQDLHELADCLRKLRAVHGPRGPVAIFGEREDVYCAARMYAVSMAAATGRPIAAFRSLDAAEQWLSEQESKLGTFG
jgi:hypothetical protein